MLPGGFTSFDCAGSPGYVGSGGVKNYPVPWVDYSSTAVPRDFSSMLDWSEYIWSTGDTRELFKRLFAYFITELEVSSVDAEQKPINDRDQKYWLNLMDYQIGWPTHAATMLDNVAAYGNDFISVVIPIKRYLQCPHCGLSRSLTDLAKLSGSDFGYQNDSVSFVARCSSVVCKSQHPERKKMIPRDIQSTDPDKFNIKHWPVREIVLYHYIWTDETHIYWKIPEDYKRAVLSGNLHTLATADIGVLEAIKKDHLFKFKEDRIFHAKEPTLSGFRSRGWGLPRTLYLSKQAWTLQLIRKQIQALGIDFITPLRIVSPANTNISLGNGVSINPNSSVNHQDFSRAMSKVFAQHRRDPTNVHSVQVPVDYSVFGGEANQLFPAEIHHTAKEDFLDAGGFPVNIYKADLTLQAAPVGLRLFEAQNKAIPNILNRGARFISERVSSLAELDPIDLRHSRVTLVDNIEHTLMRIQLATAGQLSMAQAFRPLGVDYRDDITQQMREQKFRMEKQRELEEDDVLADQGQEELRMAQPVTPPAGAPGSEAEAIQQQGGGNGQSPMPPQTPMLPSQGLAIPNDIESMQAAASSLAGTLAQMGAGTPQRQAELQILRDQNPTFHALVTSVLPQADAQWRQQAAAQMGAPPM